MKINRRSVVGLTILAAVFVAGFGMGRLSLIDGTLDGSMQAFSLNDEPAAKGLENAMGLRVPIRVEGAGHVASEFVVNDDRQTFSFFMGFSR